MKVIFLDIDGVLNTAAHSIHMHRAIADLVLPRTQVQQAEPLRGQPANGKLQFVCTGIAEYIDPTQLFPAPDLETARRQVVGKVFNQVYRDPSAPFDPIAVDNLRLILTAPREDDLRLVISSSWRSSGLQAMRDLWKRRALPGTPFDITPDFRPRPRGEEIAYWLSEHDEVTHYCIIDDDNDMLPEQQPHFVQPNGFYGLSEDDVCAARRILELPQ